MFEQCAECSARRSVVRTAFDCACEDLAPLVRAIASAASSSAKYLLGYVCRPRFAGRVGVAIAVALTATMCSYWAQSSGRPVAPAAAPADLPRLQATEKADRLDAFVREARAVGGYGEALNSSGASPLVWPLANRVSTGVRVGPNGERAYGIRIAVPVGTPVRAAADGVVDFAGNGTDGYGNKIIVKHGAIETIYGHVSEILVRKSDKVRKGQVIAKSGQSGFASSPRLYLGILGGNGSVDPIAFFNKAGTVERCASGSLTCKGRDSASKTTTAALRQERVVPPSEIPPVRPQRADHL